MSRPETLTDIIASRMLSTPNAVDRASDLAEMVANARTLRAPNANGFCITDGQPWKCATAIALTDSAAATWPEVA